MPDRPYRHVLSGLAILAVASALSQAWMVSVVFLMLWLAVLAHRSRLSGD